MGLSKTTIKRVLIIVVLAVFGLGLEYSLHRPVQSHWVPPKSSVTPAYRQVIASFGLPVRLKIPKISVDAAIDYVGVTPQGELGVPKGPTNAAWYEFGARPGNKGNAVIDGHFGYKDNIPAVFDHLNSLQKGDNIYVLDEKGKTAIFVVRELRTYAQNEDSSVIFVSSDAKAHLNLITCQGTWNESQKSYSNRLVVFADKEIH